MRPRIGLPNMFLCDEVGNPYTTEQVINIYHSTKNDRDFTKIGNVEVYQSKTDRSLYFVICPWCGTWAQLKSWHSQHIERNYCAK